MKEKFIIVYFCLLFIFVSLINSKILNMFWVNFSFDLRWSFEFLKTMTFNIFSSVFLIIYFILNFKEKINYNKNINLIFLLFFISIISSSFFLTNIFWNNIRWHSIIFYTNLIWLFIILINLEEKTKKTILKYFLYLSIIPVFLAIKEYFFSSLNYMDLEKRAFWSFWHPNFLAFFILIFLPIILKKIKNKMIFFIFILFSFAIFLSKSAIAIFLYLSYIIYYLYNKNKIHINHIYFLTLIFIIFFSYFLINFSVITKLNSFISRFFIWETSLEIYFSQIKYIIFWIWNDSLKYVFDSFKSPHLYIFENIWFTSDRPHNYYLQILLSYWVLWFSLLIFFLFKLFKNTKKNYLFHSIFLWLVFLFFNFPSVIHYILFILIFSIILKYQKSYDKNIMLKIFFIIFSIFSIISSIFYIKEENKIFKNIGYKSNIEIYNNLKKEDIEKTILKSSKTYIEICENLTNKISSAENYIFCWNLFWKIDKNISLNYYKKWLEMIPNMRDIDSKYFNNFFVKNLYNENRFFSEKYSNLKEVLKRVEIKMN